MGKRELRRDQRAYDAESQQLLAEARAATGRLLVELAVLDFNNINAVLYWLEQIMPLLAEASIMAEFPADDVVRLFRFHGFTPNTRPPDNLFNIATAKETAGRVIMGYALHCLWPYSPSGEPRRPELPREVAVFAGRWREVFAR